MFGKQKIAALVAELIGTGVLTLLVLSVQRSTIGIPFFVAAAAGLTLALMIFAVGRVSGGHFNPAITLAMWTARKVSTLTALLYVVVQVLGAWAAYGIYTYLTKNGLQEVGGEFDRRILVAEIVGTGIFGFAVAAAVYQGFSRAVTAAYAGIGLMLGAIAASAASIGILNPAVAFGIRADVFGTYILGPIIGAVVGVQLYALLFADKEAAPEAVTASAASTPAVASTAVTKPAKKTPAKKKPVAKKATTKKKPTRSKKK